MHGHDVEAVYVSTNGSVYRQTGHVGLNRPIHVSTNDGTCGCAHDFSCVHQVVWAYGNETSDSMPLIRHAITTLVYVWFAIGRSADRPGCRYAGKCVCMCGGAHIVMYVDRSIGRPVGRFVRLSVLLPACMHARVCAQVLLHACMHEGINV